MSTSILLNNNQYRLWIIESFLYLNVEAAFKCSKMIIQDRQYVLDFVRSKWNNDKNY